MKSNLFLSFLGVLIVLLTLSNFAWSGTVRIGNGDEGSDLEGFTELTSGPLYESKALAVSLLKSVNTPGIKGLGMLLPEVEESKLYLTKKDSSAVQSSDKNQFHADIKGRVYARTMPEPHAATRFFPVAEKLDADQLVALQVHEGLHRSLPANIREDESIVSEITLAITAPGANLDSIQNVVRKYIPDSEPTPNGPVITNQTAAVPMAETSRAKNPSVFGYEYRSFKNTGSEPSNFTINSMHIVNTELYPFSLGKNPFGLGLKFSYIGSSNDSFLGPLEISTKLRVWTFRGFDVGVWATASLNTLSNDELKQSQFGRDAYELGITIQRDLKVFSIENYLSYIFPGSSNEQIGNVNYQYQYGGVVNVSTHPAIMIGPVRVGGFLELLLGDYYRVTGGAFTYDPGRYRLVSVGPEIQLRVENMVFGVSGRYLIDSTKDASFDSLADLLGPGAAQGNIAFHFSIFF